MEDNIDPRWRKSSRSSGNGGACVEAGIMPGVVLVRDTTDRQGGTLAFTAAAWRAFAEGLKRDLAGQPSPKGAASA
jgi:hypothetical protein